MPPRNFAPLCIGDQNSSLKGLVLNLIVFFLISAISRFQGGYTLYFRTEGVYKYIFGFQALVSKCFTLHPKDQHQMHNYSVVAVLNMFTWKSSRFSRRSAKVRSLPSPPKCCNKKRCWKSSQDAGISPQNPVGSLETSLRKCRLV